jgi:hypothetical protein
MQKKTLFIGASLLFSQLALASIENDIRVTTETLPINETEIIEVGGNTLEPTLMSAKVDSIKVSWKKIDGKAKAITINEKGETWVVGTDHQIYRRDTGSNRWIKLPPPRANIRFDKLASASDNSLWALDTDGKIYHFNQSRFNSISGLLKEITVGVDGTVWGINAKQEVFRWNAGRWLKLSAYASKIAGHPDGYALVVGTDGHLYKGNNHQWTKLNIQANDLAIGADKSIWHLGPKKTGANGYPVFHTKQLAPAIIAKDKIAEAMDIAVTPKGKPWVINANHEIFIGQ